MSRGQSSSSGTLIVIIVVVLLLGLPLLMCGGCLFLGFAVTPVGPGPQPSVQTIRTDAVDVSNQPVVVPDDASNGPFDEDDPSTETDAPSAPE